MVPEARSLADRCSSGVTEWSSGLVDVGGTAFGGSYEGPGLRDVMGFAKCLLFQELVAQLQVMESWLIFQSSVRQTP